MFNLGIIKNRAVVARRLDHTSPERRRSRQQHCYPGRQSHRALAVWQARAPLGIWLNSETQADAIKDDPQQFVVIGINFLIFTDGRGYPTAFNLRTRYG